MKIVKPSAKRIVQTNVIDHIAYCARVCYASDKTTGNRRMYDNLIKKGHKSMLRQGTVYFVIENTVDNDIVELFRRNPYSSVHDDSSLSYITTNMQVIHDNNWYDLLKHSENCRGDNWDEGDDLYYVNNLAGYDNARITIEIVTQNVIAKQLNRTSPNNIAEQSTRYCNFSKDKFGNEISICEPVWFTTNIDEDLKHGARNDWEYAEAAYFDRLNRGLSVDQARGILPLEVATKVIYTYTIKEWRDILDLRYYGTTGKPHEDAYVVAEQIKNILEEECGYEFRDK